MWQPIETAPKDGTEILILTRLGAVSAWFCDEPCTDVDNGAYDWVCYDDAFQIDGHSSEVLGWMPLPPTPPEWIEKPDV